MKKIIGLVIILLSLNSCDCYQKVEGIIIDKQTRKPIKGAVIINSDQNYHKEVSDSLGYFEISQISGGFNCKPIRLHIESEGFESIDLKVPLKQTDTLTIELNAK